MVQTLRNHEVRPASPPSFGFLTPVGTCWERISEVVRSTQNGKRIEDPATEGEELERRTEALTSALDEGRVGGEGEGEEEGGREEWVALLKLGVYRSHDFVNSIDEEIPILIHMEAMKKGAVPVARKPEGATDIESHGALFTCILFA